MNAVMWWGCLNLNCQSPLKPRGFLAHKRVWGEEAISRMRENLWAHMLGPLNVLIQSEAVIEVSELEFDSETSQTASDWISTSKGPNVGTQRFSGISPLRLMLVREWENLWVPVYCPSQCVCKLSFFLSNFRNFTGRWKERLMHRDWQTIGHDTKWLTHEKQQTLMYQFCPL